MRKLIGYALLTAMWFGGMAALVWVLLFGGKILFAADGGILAAIATVTLAEDVAEWLHKPKAKGPAQDPATIFLAGPQIPAVTIASQIRTSPPTEAAYSSLSSAPSTLLVEGFAK
jgi:hypothetical protein